MLAAAPAPAIAAPVTAPPIDLVTETPIEEVIEPELPVYIPVPIPSRVAYTDDGRQGTLFPIYFVPETTEFRADSIPVMNNVGRRLAAGSEPQVLVRAFAISDTTDDFRYTLSVNRSRVVRDYLIRHFGILPSRIIIEAFGTERVLERDMDEWEPLRCAELLVFED